MVDLKGLIFGCPFGNYIQRDYATSTLGTFTLKPRPGRLMQILKTVRYSFVLDAWVNKIGLRNPGIDSLYKQQYLYNFITSIHGFSTEEWLELIQNKIMNFGYHLQRQRCWFELNMSCPNVTDKPLDYNWIFGATKNIPHDFIVKLPPVNWHHIFYAAIQEGLTHFHCCNTLPVHRGGMSGAPLKNYSLNVIKEIRKVHGHGKLFIIGGGGVKTKADIYDYAEAGADRVSMASGLFNPLTTAFRLKSLANYAAELFTKSV